MSWGFSKLVLFWIYIVGTLPTKLCFLFSGDKYENGVITHRPPPIQSGRTRPRPRFDRSGGGGGGSQNFQRNTQYGQQPPMQGGGGSFGPQQGYGTPGQGQGTQAPPPFQGGYNQGPGSPPPPYQASYNQSQGSPVPPYQGPQSSYGQGGSGNYSQGPQGGYNQGGPRNYSPQGAGNFGPAPGAGNFGPAPGAGNPGYGQGYSGPGQEQNQTFPQANQRNPDWNNNNPAGQPGSDQVRSLTINVSCIFLFLNPYQALKYSILCIFVTEMVLCFSFHREEDTRQRACCSELS